MTADRHLGVDVGGTFTDLALTTENGIVTAKVPTTPDESAGVIEGGRSVVGHSPANELIHGTTIATNALLERSGGRVALVTDAGFEDVIEIGRQDRPSLYDTSVTRPLPLVARDDRVGFDGDPSVVTNQITEIDPDSVAVCLAYSYLDPSGERTVAASLSGRDVSLSSEVAPEFREFERASTTVVNAYLKPVVTSYLSRLRDRSSAVADRLTVMRSSGGLLDVDEASSLPAGLLLSGPAGGVVAAGALGLEHGFPTMITLDMGGTSTDVCRIEEGRPELTYQRTIEGYVVRMPSVAVHTVGAGSGSIAWIDEGGSLRVGPHSAGAVPGPVCYGQGGTEPTVTDANVALGHIPQEVKLGGDLAIDAEAARRSMSDLGEKLGLDMMTTARGIVTVINSHMERAIRSVSVEEGVDPSEAVLVAFGGAGGLHAAHLAEGLGMSRIAIPPHAGVFSALGLVMSPPRLDMSLSVQLDEPSDITEPLDQLVATARERFSEVHGATRGRVSAYADMRYRGQAHELTIEAGPNLVERFHDEHRQRNGFSRPEDPVEVVTLRVEVVSEPALRWGDLIPGPPVNTEPFDVTIDTGTGEEQVACHRRDTFGPGDTMDGPAIIVEDIGTTLVPPGWRLDVLADSTVLMEVE
ncbi:MAG: hydantoinase/oxoprolinase family protein [Acidimicrobiia bacterium]|nr:hydantoinase/oxoprolinase family protein [Acidimicrobiia bacterium]